jgi:hypothetical protein
MTYFFRFPNKATCIAALEDAGLLTKDGNPIIASHTHALDVIGIISRGGEYDPKTGKVLTPPTLLDGWHVNYAGEPPAAWEGYLVTPQHPVRVWA